jgi:hypothetical protein
MENDLATEIKHLYRERSMGGGRSQDAFEAAIALYRERTGASLEEARRQVDALVTAVQKDPEGFTD